MQCCGPRSMIAKNSATSLHYGIYGVVLCLIAFSTSISLPPIFMTLPTWPAHLAEVSFQCERHQHFLQFTVLCALLRSFISLSSYKVCRDKHMKTSLVAYITSRPETVSSSLPYSWGSCCSSLSDFMFTIDSSMIFIANFCQSLVLNMY